MRTYAADEAKTELLDLIDRALAGEPQRIRRGEEAVVLVAERDWNGGGKPATTLVDLFLKHAGDAGYEELEGPRPWTSKRPLGADFDG